MPVRAAKEYHRILPILIPRAPSLLGRNSRKMLANMLEMLLNIVPL